MIPDIIKPKVWNGKDLKGLWEITRKIDGVRALWDVERQGWYSRANKPLYNIPSPVVDTYPYDCECYLGSLKDSVRAVRTQHLKPDTPVVERKHLYSLAPLDPRLNHAIVQDPPASYLVAEMERVIELGYEGLVARCGDHWVKIKPKDNLDLLVTGYEEGEGKHAGRLGALITRKGKVGTGFTDHDRELFWYRRHGLVGMTIEVAYMHLTPDGQMRHPRFVRERFDKEATE